MTTVIAENFEHYDAEGAQIIREDAEAMARGRAEYSLWKLALRRTWSRSVMFYAVDVGAGHRQPARLDYESELRLLHASGQISDEVFEARMNPEKYEAEFNRQQEEAFERDRLARAESDDMIGANDE